MEWAANLYRATINQVSYGEVRSRTTQSARERCLAWIVAFSLILYLSQREECERECEQGKGTCRTGCWWRCVL